MAYGRIISGLKIDGKPAEYGVVNERTARAAAGIMMMLGIFAVVFAFFLKEFLLLGIVVTAFTIEFGLRLIQPKYGPIFAISEVLLFRMKPEYSGAAQKRFAWLLGFCIALLMLFMVNIFAVRGIIPFSFCILCITLMWLESAFGFCVGCKMYYGLIRLGVFKQPKIAPACPGGVCPIRKP